MAIKFTSNNNDNVTAWCDLCGNTVYATTIDSIMQAVDNQKNPYICNTYKIYCEYCYMFPLKKIKELVEIVEELQAKLERKEKRVKNRLDRTIKDQKERLDEINNDFY